MMVVFKRLFMVLWNTSIIHMLGMSLDDGGIQTSVHGAMKHVYNT